MRYDAHHIILDSGKKIYAFSGTIGLTPGLELTYGFDGFISEFSSEDFTSEDAQEVADYMIRQWQTFRALASTPSALEGLYQAEPGAQG